MFPRDSRNICWQAWGTDIEDVKQLPRGGADAGCTSCRAHSSGSCTFRFTLYRLQLLLCVTQCAPRIPYASINYGITALRVAIGRNQDRRLPFNFKPAKNQLPENNNQKREGVERAHGAAIPNFGSLSSPRFPRKRPLRNGDLSGAVSWRRNSRASGHRRLRMDSHWPEVGGASPLAELT
jgi:hypothetical protein